MTQSDQEASKPARKSTKKRVAVRGAAKASASKKTAPKMSVSKASAKKTMGKSDTRGQVKARPQEDTAKPSPPPTARAQQEAAALIGEYQSIVQRLAKLSANSNEIMQAHIRRQMSVNPFATTASTDPLNMGEIMRKILRDVLANPTQTVTKQANLWEDYLRLWQNSQQKFIGNTVDPIIEPAASDRRFAHSVWSENDAFDFLKQSYLLTARWLHSLIDSAENTDDETKKRAKFYAEQFLAALSPTNFPITNPEVIEETIRTNGENYVRGLSNFLEDIERGKGELQMKQSDMDSFKVGENIATTPGKVVFQNKILQLIQYAPVTEKVAKRPLLIFPPWINKFYIMDLQPENSLIKWLVEQGRTVFVVSWVNPDARHKNIGFEDYIHLGAYGALDAVEQATGEKQIDAVGYCIGGTMLASSLAHMAAKGDGRIKSATFFTAQMDFEDAGELKFFVDSQQLANLEAQMDAADGILQGAAMRKTFDMLRPRDLIWSVYIENYLKGREARKFDLLYWNSDVTGMTKRAHLFYLREFYHRNAMALNKLRIDGVMLELSRIKIPVFMQAGEKDHIAPPNSVYRSARLFGGDVEYMLAGSGHIAGVINHPAKQKYHYRTNKDLPPTSAQWMEDAQMHPYSWWPYWIEWLKSQNNTQVPARQPGEGALSVIEDAPGSYVKVQNA